MSKVVLFDVDGTVSDGCVNREGGDGQARPGVLELFEVVHALGYRIALWSSCGADHAGYVAAYLKLPHVDGGCFTKPFGPGPPDEISLVVDDLPEFLATLPDGVPTLHFRHAYEILHPAQCFDERDLN